MLNYSYTPPIKYKKRNAPNIFPCKTLRAPVFRQEAYALLLFVDLIENSAVGEMLSLSLVPAAE